MIKQTSRLLRYTITMYIKYTLSSLVYKCIGSFYIISTTFLGDTSELDKTWYKVSSCGRVKSDKNLYAFLSMPRNLASTNKIN